VGHDVFILGYPFGIAPGGFPIWKRGSIASEPQLLDAHAPYILVDSAGRPGMSGSPVLRRTWGVAQMENGGVQMGPAMTTRFVGIYSGRLQPADPVDAQLGMIWPAQLVPEIITGQIRDS